MRSNPCVGIFSCSSRSLPLLRGSASNVAGGVWEGCHAVWCWLPDSERRAAPLSRDGRAPCLHPRVSPEERHATAGATADGRGRRFHMGTAAPELGRPGSSVRTASDMVAWARAWVTHAAPFQNGPGSVRGACSRTNYDSDQVRRISRVNQGGL